MDEFLKVCHAKSELHTDDGEVTVFNEGKLSEDAILRNKIIRSTLEQGFLSRLIDDVLAGDTADVVIDQTHIDLLDGLVNSITSEVGRALVGLTVLQLSIKTIAKEQSIRLHKGSTNKNAFSWSEGISMRTLDKSYITPVLRKYDLLKLNADGFMMTRSLAENYPYTRLYKAAVRGAKAQWIEITDELERGALDPENGLRYLLSILINQSENFKISVENVIKSKDSFLSSEPSAESVFSLIVDFIKRSEYGARVFEVSLHSAYQALDEMGRVEGYLKSLSQMRSANKKHGNIGDIEILKSNIGVIIEESWDAKYGKTDLREEVEEIAEKLASHPDCEIAGFITDQQPTLSDGLLDRMEQISEFYGCNVEILSFADWYKNLVEEMGAQEVSTFNKLWLTAITESFGQRRRKQAPIDEPCELWIETLSEILNKRQKSKA